MSARVVAVWVLLAVAGAVTFVCSVGVAVMRDPLQRLHFVSPPTTLASALVTAALLLDEHDLDGGGKVVFITVILGLMNGVATHATARAARVRTRGTWRPVPGEHVPIRGESGEVPPVVPEHRPAQEEG